MKAAARRGWRKISPVFCNVPVSLSLSFSLFSCLKSEEFRHETVSFLLPSPSVLSSYTVLASSFHPLLKTSFIPPQYENPLLRLPLLNPTLSPFFRLFLTARENQWYCYSVTRFVFTMDGLREDLVLCMCFPVKFADLFSDVRIFKSTVRSHFM